MSTREELEAMNRKAADERAFEIERDRLIQVIKDTGQYVKFEGFNCNDDEDDRCSGWDGESRRCECGNRRVSWVMGDSHSFTNPDVYAEAF